MKSLFMAFIYVFLATGVFAHAHTNQKITVKNLMQEAKQTKTERTSAGSFQFSIEGEGTNTIGYVQITAYSGSSCSSVIGTATSDAGGSISVTANSIWYMDATSIYKLFDNYGIITSNVRSMSVKACDTGGADPCISTTVGSSPPSSCPCFSVTCSGSQCIGTTVNSVQMGTDSACNFP